MIRWLTGIMNNGKYSISGNDNFLYKYIFDHYNLNR